MRDSNNNNDSMTIALEFPSLEVITMFFRTSF